MKNKRFIILLIGIILIVTCIIFEYVLVGEGANHTYYVQVKQDGRSVKLNQFKGYKYTETVYDAQGRRKSLSFYTPKELSKNKRFKIVMNNTHLVNQFKRVKHFPKQVKHIAKR